MFKFILHTIFQQNKMHESTLDLFCQHDEVIADEYAMELEQKAAELEITVDYYMMEFM
jgi:hypothetical protein